ncbi:MAG: hypothetical protein SNJ56_04080 [Termitinemataceae bacterium]
MDAQVTFQSELAQALDQRKAWLDHTEMPQLKEAFSVFKGAFNSLYQVLLHKGLVEEDPYKNDIKIGELETPSEAPFTESERMEQMSIRLSAYDSQLDFLLTFYQFSVDFLTMERMKRVVGIVKYFNWLQVSPNSQYVNTRALAEIVNIAKAGNDQLAAGIIADSIVRLEQVSKNILKYLKEISDFHRENYKLEARLRFFDKLTFDKATVFTKKDETMLQIKRKFAETMGDRPFYPELMEEILKEDYSAEGPALKQELLKKLSLPQETPQTKKAAASLRPMLLEGFKGLSTLSYILTDAISKLQDNKILLDSQQNGFWQKVKLVILKMLNKDLEEVFYDIEYLDPLTGMTKSEKINFGTFLSDLNKKARFLAALTTRGSNVMARLEAASDEQLLSMLSKNIEELQRFHRVLAGIDEFFKTEISKENRDRVRGIKPEISAIKNGIVKANQKRHEYIAQKEEEEQMKRLGIEG